MRISLPPDVLQGYVLKLIAHQLPDGYVPDPGLLRYFGRTLERVEHCFSRIQRKYFHEAGVTVFDHMNGDHMAMLLYYFSNTVWRETGDTELPTRLFYVNKVLHGIDIFYSLAMPDIFLLVHPVGTVLGHADYKDYLVIYQNCTVGAITNVYPKFGQGTILYSRTSVLGDCHLGDDVVVAANAFLVDSNVPANTIVVGQYPNHKLLPNERSVRERCFDAAAA